MFFSILIFLIILSILIFVHEFGHFIMAKRSGVWVEEFGLGLPPRVFEKKIGGTIYSLNALPFGGFVRLHGESTDEKLKYPKKAFINKDKKTRVKIIIAGVIMHFVLAIISFAIVYSATGIQKETKDVRVLEVAAGSPSQISGLLVGDIVREVDGKKIETSDSFINFVGEKKGKKIKVTIERKVGDKSETKKFTMTPRENPPNSEGPLGVAISNIEVYFPPLIFRPFVGIYYGFKDAFIYGSTILVSLIKIF